MTQRRKALFALDTQVGFDELSWGSPNNPCASLNAIRRIGHCRNMGRQFVIIRRDSPDPDEKSYPRDRYCTVIARSTVGEEERRPAQLKPGLY